ncbi:DUF4811 domain-containing protein [Bombilactobacillus bombi]|uniref:DUF4811 domain-containing protein n=1 Tax=Bombilactobacillus bombi TaxID=1303590 RepID=UPI0015E61BD8|nr:DUF4811 domain-containing protein [Bombilactobacillus bombi]MBA1434237.1 DUF4811 domain-containing protein [Bombilactobacillus bombi]
MIIFLLVIMTLIAYFGGVYVDNRQVANWIRAICDLFIIGILALMVANDTFHFGMQPQVQTTKTTIQSANPHSSLPLLLYKNIGTNGKNRVYIYQANLKTQHTSPEQTTIKVKRTSQEPHLVSQKKQWHYRNNFYRALFGVAGNEGHHIQTVNTFYVPQSWLVLSTGQAKALPAKLANPQVKARLKQTVSQQVLAELKQHPHYSLTQQKQLTHQLQTKYQRQALEKLVK